MGSELLVGVNDCTQISNQSFHNDDAVLTRLVKPESNASLDIKRHNRCVQNIQKADLICIYGSSIGNTDNIWWENIGARMYHSNCKLIIFHYDPNISENDWNFAFDAAEIRRRIKTKFDRRFLKRIDPFENVNTIKDRVYININSPIFKMRELF